MLRARLTLRATTSKSVIASIATTLQKDSQAAPSNSPFILGIRGLATPTMTTVSSKVKKDHRDLESWYDKIIHSSDSDVRTRFQNQFTWELARHSVSEELVVYPAFEKYLTGGTDIAEKDREQHQSVKEQLKEFQDLNESDPSFNTILKSLMSDLSRHIKEEEGHDLPMLEEALTDEESNGLANKFERTKMFVPSRSHPLSPRKPPFETAVGLMTAPIDRLSDIFRRFPDINVTSHPAPQAAPENKA